MRPNSHRLCTRESEGWSYSEAPTNRDRLGDVLKTKQGLPRWIDQTGREEEKHFKFTRDQLPAWDEIKLEPWFHSVTRAHKMIQIPRSSMSWLANPDSVLQAKRPR